MGGADDHSQLAGTVCVNIFLRAPLKPQILLPPGPHEHITWKHAVFNNISTAPGRAETLDSVVRLWRGISARHSPPCHIKRGCNVCACKVFFLFPVHKGEDYFFPALSENISVLRYSFYFFFFTVCVCARYRTPHLDRTRESCQRPI